MSAGPLILHPLLARRENVEHEKVKRETPFVPMEVMGIIVKHLDARSVCSFALASKRCRDMTNDDVLWKRLYSQKFPMPGEMPNGKWKEMYKFQTKFIKEVRHRGRGEPQHHVLKK